MQGHSHPTTPDRRDRSTVHRLGVNGRLLAGFGGLLALLVVLAGVGVASLTIVRADFADFVDSAKETTTVEDFGRAFLEARLAVEDFTVAGNDSAAQRARASLQQAELATRSFADLGSDPDMRNEFKKAQRLMVEYGKAFAALTKLNSQKDLIVSRAIERAESEVLADLAQIIERSFENANFESAYYATRARRHWQTLLTSARQATTTNDAQPLSIVESERDDFRTSMNTMRAALTDSYLIALTADIDDATSQYFQGIEKLVEVLDQRNETIGQELAPVGQRIIEIVEAIDEETTRDQDRQAALALELGRQIGTLTAVVAFLSLAVGAGVAIGLVRGIRRPIHHLSSAMRRLADGDPATEVRGSERVDEIGEMVRAFNTLREGVIERQRLEAREAEMRRFQEESARRMEDLVADLDQAVETMLDTAAIGPDMESVVPSSSDTARPGETGHRVAAAPANVRATAETLSRQAEDLRSRVRAFLDDIKAA